MARAEVAHISVAEMIDLALGTPEDGIVDFNMLQAVLHVLAQQQHVLTKGVELRGAPPPPLPRAQSNTVIVTEYTLETEDAQEKSAPVDVKTKDAKSSPDTMLVVERIKRSAKEETTAKPLEVHFNNQTSTKVPEHRLSVPTLNEFHKLEATVDKMKSQVFGGGVKSEMMLEHVRNNPGSNVISDMWTSLNVSTRIEALEEGLSKLSSLVQDLAEEYAGLQSSGGAATPGSGGGGAEGATGTAAGQAHISSDFSEQIEMLRDELSRLTGTVNEICGIVDGYEGDKRSVRYEVYDQGSEKNTVGDQESEMNAVDRQESGKNAVDGQGSGKIAVDRQESGKNAVAGQGSGKIAVDRQESGKNAVAGQGSGKIAVDRQESGKNAVAGQGSGKIAVDRQESGKNAVAGQGSGKPMKRRDSGQSTRDLNVRLDALEKRMRECCDKIDKVDGVVGDQLTSFQDQLIGLGDDITSVNENLASGNWSPDVSKDVKGMADLFNLVRELQLEVQSVRTVAESLAQEKGERGINLNMLIEQVELLKTIKMDREDLAEAMAEKADARLLARKVSHDQFETTCDDLSRGLENALSKLTTQESLWQQALDDIQREIENKLDKLELAPMKQFFMDKLRKLQENLRQMADLRREAEAAGTKKKFLRDVNCISCDARAIMATAEATMLPAPRAMPPAHHSIKPYLTYELDKIRKQQTAGPSQRNMLDWENIDSQSKQKPPAKVRSTTSKHICIRYCGGSHTVTTPAQRVARAGHFLREWGPDVMPLAPTKEQKTVKGETTSGVPSRTSSKAPGDDAKKGIDSLGECGCLEQVGATG